MYQSVFNNIPVKGKQCKYADDIVLLADTILNNAIYGLDRTVDFFKYIKAIRLADFDESIISKPVMYRSLTDKVVTEVKDQFITQIINNTFKNNVTIVNEDDDYLQANEW